MSPQKRKDFLSNEIGRPRESRTFEFDLWVFIRNTESGRREHARVLRKDLSKFSSKRSRGWRNEYLDKRTDTATTQNALFLFVYMEIKTHYRPTFNLGGNLPIRMLGRPTVFRLQWKADEDIFIWNIRTLWRVICSSSAGCGHHCKSKYWLLALFDTNCQVVTCGKRGTPLPASRIDLGHWLRPWWK